MDVRDDSDEDADTVMPTASAATPPAFDFKGVAPSTEATGND